VIIRNIDMKFEVDTFRKKELLKEQYFFMAILSSREDILENFMLELKTLSHMMWLITRNLYLKFEENILRNKELIVKKR
jgi:hypothetical protein